MAWSGQNYDEVRFIFHRRETHVYVLIRARGEAIPGVAGWHFKAFKANIFPEEIFRSIMNYDWSGPDGAEELKNAIQAGHDPPALWPRAKFVAEVNTHVAGV